MLFIAIGTNRPEPELELDAHLNLSSFFSKYSFAASERGAGRCVSKYWKCACVQCVRCAYV